MKKKYISLFIILVFAIACTSSKGGRKIKTLLPSPKLDSSVLNGKIICLDPGHGDSASTDNFRVGPTGEREEWINLRVAMMLKKMLENTGAKVIMTRTADIHVDLSVRANMAIENKADIFVSIHHNGTMDRDVDYPLVFFHGKAPENPASVDFGRILVDNFKKNLNYKHLSREYSLDEAGLFSDKLIYNSGFRVIRLTYPYMPAVIGEAAFFSHPVQEKYLKKTEYNQKEAEAYFDALVEYFSNGIPTIELLAPENNAELSTMVNEVHLKLNDGCSECFFDVDSFITKINENDVKHLYDPLTGSLKLFCDPPLQTGEYRVFVSARNLKGNSLHPKRLAFKIK